MTISGLSSSDLSYVRSLLGGKRLKATSVFIGQLTLALSLAGQLLFIIGLEAEISNIPLTILLTIILEGVLIALYPDKLHRFLSTLVICGALFWLFIDQEVAEVSHLLVILLAIGTVLMWQFEAPLTGTRLNRLYRPLGYACPLALFGFLSLSFVNEIEIEWWWVSAVGLLGVLLYLEYLILSQHDLPWQSKTGLWFLVGTAILIVPASQTPGILAALIGLLLGYHRGNRLLLGLATAFLALFIIGYYYNLDLTLLTKSFVMMGTGLIFLGLRYGLQVIGGTSPIGSTSSDE